MLWRSELATTIRALLRRRRDQYRRAIRRWHDAVQSITRISHRSTVTNTADPPTNVLHHAPIASEDQGRLIAAILQDPAPQVGKIYTLHESIEMSHYEIVQAMGKALGRELHYQPIMFEEFAQDRLQAIGSNPHLVQHLREVALDYQNGIFAEKDDVIGQVTGQPPMSVETFVEMNRIHFGQV
jgi:NAD(P)H dehydrogenase (quinone)